MKRFFKQIILFLIIFGLFTGCSSRNKLNNMFGNFEAETKQNTAFVYYNTLVFENNTVDFEHVLKDNQIDGIFLEVYLVKNNTLWFGYSDFNNNDTQWNIATITFDDNTVNVHYSGVFCKDAKADKTYKKSNNYKSNIFMMNNGFYYDEKIILTDHVKTIEFDLETLTSKDTTLSNYNYSTPSIQVIDLENEKILFSNGIEEKCFDFNQAKLTSDVFNKLLTLNGKNNWQGKSYLSEFFENVQIINNHIYLICQVINWDGEIHALIFEYDFEENACKYFSQCFMDDNINDNLYIVTTLIDRTGDGSLS